MQADRAIEIICLIAIAAFRVFAIDMHPAALCFFRVLFLEPVAGDIYRVEVTST